MNRSAGIVLVLLVALSGLIALVWFWPDQKPQQSQAIFSYLQFGVTLVLALLTYCYVSATNRLVAAQNKPPSIRVTYVTAHLRTPPGMLFQFSVTIANPSTRGTSIEAGTVTVNSVNARSVLFAGMRRHVILHAGNVDDFVLDAEFDTTPISPGIRGEAELTFSDIIQGELPIVRATV